MSIRTYMQQKPYLFIGLGLVLYFVFEMLEQFNLLQLPDFFDGFVTGLSVGFVLAGVFFLLVRLFKPTKTKSDQ